MANPNIINVASILAGNAGFNLTATATATLITVLMKLYILYS